MLSIKNLHASVEEKNIIKGLNLEVKPGEVHAIMGPNGAGKSTLGYVLSGRDGYEVSEGEATLNGKDLLELDVEERAREGPLRCRRAPLLHRRHPGADRQAALSHLFYSLMYRMEGMEGSRHRRLLN